MDDDIDDGFIEKDIITGRKIKNKLNKKKLSAWEMDEMFLEGLEREQREADIF